MKKGFKRNAILLGISTFSVRLIGFMFRLLLVRQLTAQELGIYQLVLPVVGIIGAICATGLPDAVARITAKMGGIPSRHLLRTSLLLALLVSLPLSALLLLLGPFIAQHIIHEASAAPILLALTPLPPLLAMSAVYQGICLGKEDAFHPALASALDQLMRMGSTLCIWAVMGQNYQSMFAASAYFCMSIGQSMGLAILRQGGRKSLQDGEGMPIGKLALHAAPVTVTQLLASGMRALSEMLMPLFIMGTGLTRSQALAQYGMVAGMALPLAFIPMSLLAPLTQLLSPGIAAQKARHEDREAQNRAWRSLRMSLIISSLSAAIVFAWAPQLANMLYHRPEVALYIRIVAPIIPLNSVMGLMSSMITGLGQPRKVLIIRTSMDVTYLALAALLIPRIGWLGYTIAHLIQGTIMLFWLLSALRKAGLPLHLPQAVLKAYMCAAVGACAGIICSYYVYLLVPIVCLAAHGILALSIGLYPPITKLKFLKNRAKTRSPQLADP